MTLKQFEDLYGAEEAQEMIEDGLVMERRNPLNKKRKQYKIIQHLEEKKLKKIDNFSLTPCCAIMYVCFFVLLSRITHDLI